MSFSAATAKAKFQPVSPCSCPHRKLLYSGPTILVSVCLERKILDESSNCKQELTPAGQEMCLGSIFKIKKRKTSVLQNHKLRIQERNRKKQKEKCEVGADAICPLLPLLDFGVSLSLVMLLCQNQLPLTLTAFATWAAGLLDQLFVSHWPFGQWRPTPQFIKTRGSHSTALQLHERYEDDEAGRRGTNQGIFRRSQGYKVTSSHGYGKL